MDEFSNSKYKKTEFILYFYMFTFFISLTADRVNGSLGGGVKGPFTLGNDDDDFYSKGPFTLDNDKLET